MNPFDKQAPIPGIKHIVVIGSGKGGVGKSTVAINTAKSLDNKGRRVGLLDSDVYGPSLHRMLGALNQVPHVTEDQKLVPLQRQGLKLMGMGLLAQEDQPAIWRGPMLFKILHQFLFDTQWGELDYLIVDLPPETGDVPLSIAQKVPVSLAITVCTPQNVALADAKKAMAMFEQFQIPLFGVVENMSYLKMDDGEKRELFSTGTNRYLFEL